MSADRVLLDTSMAVLPFDLAGARMDLQTAATAGAHGMPLVTRNPADFVGLEHFVEIVAV